MELYTPFQAKPPRAMNLEGLASFLPGRNEQEEYLEGRDNELHILPDGLFSKKVIDSIRDSMAPLESRSDTISNIAAASVSIEGRKLRKASFQITALVSQHKKKELVQQYKQETQAKSAIQKVLQGIGPFAIVSNSAEKRLRHETMLKLGQEAKNSNETQIPPHILITQPDDGGVQNSNTLYAIRQLNISDNETVDLLSLGNVCHTDDARDTGFRLRMKREGLLQPFSHGLARTGRERSELCADPTVTANTLPSSSIPGVLDELKANKDVHRNLLGAEAILNLNNEVGIPFEARTARLYPMKEPLARKQLEEAAESETRWRRDVDDLNRRMKPKGGRHTSEKRPLKSLNAIGSVHDGLGVSSDATAIDDMETRQDRQQPQLRFGASSPASDTVPSALSSAEKNEEQTAIDSLMGLDVLNPEQLAQSNLQLKVKRRHQILTDAALVEISAPRVLDRLVSQHRKDHPKREALPSTQARQFLQTIATRLRAGGAIGAGSAAGKSEFADRVRLRSLRSNLLEAVGGQAHDDTDANAEPTRNRDIVLRFQLRTRTHVSRRMARAFLFTIPSVVSVGHVQHLPMWNELYVELLWTTRGSAPSFTVAEQVQMLVEDFTAEVSSPFMNSIHSSTNAGAKKTVSTESGQRQELHLTNDRKRSAFAAIEHSAHGDFMRVARTAFRCACVHESSVLQMRLAIEKYSSLQDRVRSGASHDAIEPQLVRPFVSTAEATSYRPRLVVADSELSQSPRVRSILAAKSGHDISSSAQPRANIVSIAKEPERDSSQTTHIYPVMSETRLLASLTHISARPLPPFLQFTKAEATGRVRFNGSHPRLPASEKLPVKRNNVALNLKWRLNI